MLSLLFILILWTWQLTPLLVNIIGTILMSIRFVYRFICLWSRMDFNPDEEQSQ